MECKANTQAPHCFALYLPLVGTECAEYLMIILVFCCLTHECISFGQQQWQTGDLIKAVARFTRHTARSRKFLLPHIQLSVVSFVCLPCTKWEKPTPREMRTQPRLTHFAMHVRNFFEKFLFNYESIIELFLSSISGLIKSPQQSSELTWALVTFAEVALGSIMFTTSARKPQKLRDFLTWRV